MMPWQEQLRTIVGGLEQLSRTAALLIPAPHGQEAHGVAEGLWEEANKLTKRLKSIRDNQGDLLPSELATEIDNLFQHNGAARSLQQYPHEKNNVKCMMAVLSWSSLISYKLHPFLEDKSEIIIDAVERALIHLNWSIACDSQLRQSWQDDFNRGEVCIEKLGALQLLRFGVWAFKAQAIVKQQTDLILGEQGTFGIPQSVKRQGGMMAHTEWKLVKDKDAVERVISDASKQSRSYRAGVLAGFILTNYTYIVLVKEKPFVDGHEDFQKDGVQYRVRRIEIQARKASDVSKAE